MSHKATVKTKINNLEILKKTIKDLGYSYYEGQELVGRWTKGWNGSDRQVDLVMEIESRKDIGFRKDADGFYNLTGDFWGFKKGQKGLSDEILQRYNINYVQDTIENSSEGLSSMELSTLENGDIVGEIEVGVA